MAHDGDEGMLKLRADASAARVAAEARFSDLAAGLSMALPRSAEVCHVGATAVPGCLTKGDLDIVVRVDRADFGASDKVLAARFARNEGSVRTDDFAAFVDAGGSPHVGVQLTVKGGSLDVFHQFVEALRRDPALVRRYNDLKLGFNGRPMADYRTAKDAFIAEVFATRGLRAP